MRLSVKYLVAGTAWLFIVLVCVYGASGLTGSTLLTVATPTPGGTPAPPTLTSPAVISPGTTPLGICSIHGNGTTDDFGCFQSIMSAGHDLDIRAGTYLLTPTYNSDGYNMPSGRNIYCENPSWPPTAANATVIMKITAAPTAGFNLFYEWSNGTLYGCEFEGYHYPNTTWSGDTNAGAGDSVVLQFTSTNWNAYNNGFDGWAGSTAPISINEASATQFAAGHWPSNMNVSYNRFNNCNVRSVETDYGKNIQITHNTMTDCPTKSEIQDWHWTGMSVLYDSNTITTVTGSGGGSNSNGINNASDGGDVCISGISNNPADDKFCSTFSSSCSSGCPSDYHGNTFSNNTLSGSPTSYMIENCWGNPAGSCNNPVYRGNTFAGGWVQQATPGNPSANSWGAGSTQ